MRKKITPEKTTPSTTADCRPAEKIITADTIWHEPDGARRGFHFKKGDTVTGELAAIATKLNITSDKISDI